MRRQSTNFKKAILGIMTTVVSMPAIACHLISVEALQSKSLSEQDIEVLIDEKVLLKTEVSNQFSINKDRIDILIQESGDQELQSFVKWLKNMMDSNTDVNNPVCDEMVLSTQDTTPIVR